MKKILLTFIVLTTSGCGMIWNDVPGKKTMLIHQYSNELEREHVPGTVYGPWAETMQQDVFVPGAIDAKGMYYRMPHREIVEIKQEKYQRAQYPDADKIYRERD